MLGTINLFCDAGNIMMWVLVAIVAIAIIVMPIMSRKRQKEVNDVLATIDVGDEIMTISGMIGKVVALDKHESGEKLMIIETGEGDAKTRMTFSIRALSVNFTKTKQRQAQLEKQKAEKEKGKKGKKDSPLDELASSEAQSDETAEFSTAESETSDQTSEEENK